MEAALNNFHTLIGTKECKDNRKILIFEWTDTDPYSLPLKAFEEAISTVKHPIPSASWSPFTRQINKKNKNVDEKKVKRTLTAQPREIFVKRWEEEKDAKMCALTQSRTLLCNRCDDRPEK
eukprot:181496_1